MMRHAKSDWDASFGDDRTRPLNERGRRSAAAMGRLLSLTGRVPDAAITSPAVRARSTLEIALEAGGWHCPVVVDDRLYHGGPDTVIEAVRDHAGRSARLMIVGHEPTWSMLIADLGGGAVRMVTGAVVALEVPEWPSLRRGSGRLLWMSIPRMLTDGDLHLEAT